MLRFIIWTLTPVHARTVCGFRTLYVEVYLYRTEPLTLSHCGFRTLYVEVYQKLGAEFELLEQHCFRTLYVEVYLTA